MKIETKIGKTPLTIYKWGDIAFPNIMIDVKEGADLLPFVTIEEAEGQLQAVIYANGGDEPTHIIPFVTPEAEAETAFNIGDIVTITEGYWRDFTAKVIGEAPDTTKYRVLLLDNGTVNGKAKPITDDKIFDLVPKKWLKFKSLK